MIDRSIIEEISNKIRVLISETPADDIDKALRALLQGIFAKLDLVTREEFDVQSQILLQARNRLVVLEQRISELESPEEQGRISHGDRSPA